MIQKVRTAVVGCGMISQVYLRNLIEQFTIIDVAGCCDLKPGLARKNAEQFGIQVLTFEDIQKDPSVELVINLTAPQNHYEVIKQLLYAGKHVYTEKVLSLTFDEGKELVKLADEKKLYLGAAPDTFLGSAIQTARFVLDSGIIGEVTACTAVLNRDNRVGAEVIPYLSENGGGIAYDVGIYYITALLYLIGPIAEVAGFMTTRNAQRVHIFPRKQDYDEPYTMKCENLCIASLRFANGVFGNVQFNSECIMNRYPELNIYGTEGILYLPDPDAFGGIIKVLRRGNADPFVLAQNHGYSENSRGLGAAELAWSIRKNRKPRASKEMALHAIEILEGISTSGETGTFYKLKTSFSPAPPLPQGFLKMSEFADFPADQEAALTK
ncbi:MAG: Gfo/Idh/MocA family oxidoreductase [Spirochaetaceae bacterium]|jgi:predicted dehydrogenase|nr:Gfo/Idh/MocA family oxidoreductase [Spirochaetaceae bacterium]